MPLANAVQNARHTAQQITWTRDDGTAVNLDGATLTGRIHDEAAGTTRNVTGALAIVTAASGIFSWTYSAADVATAGVFQVQFSATFVDTLKDTSYTGAWTVYEAI